MHLVLSCYRRKQSYGRKWGKPSICWCLCCHIKVLDFIYNYLRLMKYWWWDFFHLLFSISFSLSLHLLLFFFNKNILLSWQLIKPFIELNICIYLCIMTPYCKSALGSSQVHSYTIWSSLLTCLREREREFDPQWMDLTQVLTYTSEIWNRGFLDCFQLFDNEVLDLSCDWFKTLCLCSQHSSMREPTLFWRL